MVKIMEICLALIAMIVIILICFIVKKVTKNKKIPISILLIIIGVIVVSAVGIGFVKFSNDEQYVVVNENNQEVSIKLKNHKDYFIDLAVLIQKKACLRNLKKMVIMHIMMKIQRKF